MPTVTVYRYAWIKTQALNSVIAFSRLRVILLISSAVVYQPFLNDAIKSVFRFPFQFTMAFGFWFALCPMVKNESLIENLSTLHIDGATCNVFAHLA